MRLGFAIIINNKQLLLFPILIRTLETIRTNVANGQGRGRERESQQRSDDFDGDHETALLDVWSATSWEWSKDGVCV